MIKGKKQKMEQILKKVQELIANFNEQKKVENISLEMKEKIDNNIIYLVGFSDCLKIARTEAISEIKSFLDRVEKDAMFVNRGYNNAKNNRK